MSIESHYNKLREIANDLINIANESGTLSSDNYDKARKRIHEVATEFAAADWPRVRRAIAEAAEEMPENPRKFCIYQGNCYGNDGTRYGGIWSDRKMGLFERDYVTEAIVFLQKGEFIRQAEAAHAEFEDYRRAVAQGVAIDPGS